MTKQEALNEINEAQDFYVSKLADVIVDKDKSFDELVEYNFTSPTGTGKTVMLAKLFNLLPEHFFVVTSLSRGQLKTQIKHSLERYCKQQNYIVWGLNDFTKTTNLQSKDILSVLSKHHQIVWIRDEGHIATNKWQMVLRQKASHIINVSATNKNANGIQCNFAHTMMLRTVSQNEGTPEDALDRLIAIKRFHKQVKGYNPCALFRLLHDSNLERVIAACNERGLKYINITNDNFNMEDLCQDDNRYDVIINKFKITEGIDLRRCHVIYMDSRPSSEATTIQVIGRARRNALFWRNDIDIMNDSNRSLLEQTRQCFVYYNVPETEVTENEAGELAYSLCDTVSVEALKSNISIRVENGQLSNGLHIIELEGRTGVYSITQDKNLGVNVVNNPEFYRTIKQASNPFVIDLSEHNYNIQRIYVKPTIIRYFQTASRTKREMDYSKFFFYFARWYFAKNPPAVGRLDLDYWADYLDVNNKRRAVSDKKWDEFCRYIRDHKLGMVWLEVGTYDKIKKRFSDQEIEVAKEFARIDQSPTIVARKDIFMCDSFGIYSFFHPDFLQHVESVEYQDTSVLFAVADKLKSEHGVVQQSPDSYLYAPHPFSDYLVNRGIDTFKKLEQKIAVCDKKSFLRCPVSYWKDMLSKVHSFAELDEYDVRVLSFAELNDELQLGFNQIEVEQYSKGIFPLVTSRYFPDCGVLKWDSAGKTFKDIGRAKHVIYRNSFSSAPVSYNKVWNDYEIAAVGPDLMKYSNRHYVEDTPVTSKISKYCKFNSFLEKRYASILANCSPHYFKIDNNLGFDKKCNSCLGFCVEYFAKIKLFGDDAYRAFIELACLEGKTKEITDAVRVRASMIAYREAMKACYGFAVSSIIPSLSMEALLNQKYKPFVNKVVELGNRTATFVLNNVYGGHLGPETPRHDANLSVNHISALCDFITEDTILDLKCTSSITEKHIKQILAYHYLASKRSDLHIKKLIVFDAPTQRSLVINL